MATQEVSSAASVDEYFQLPAAADGAIETAAAVAEADAAEVASCNWRFWTWSTAAKIRLGVLLGFVLMISILLALRVHTYFGDVLRWFDEHKTEGAVVFIVLMAVVTVLLLPALLLSLGAGYVYRVWLGSLIVWIASSIGLLAAFLLGRYVFREAVARRVAKNPKARALDLALAHHGWKILLLLRLAPVIPFTWLNYLMSATRISFAKYAVTSVLGIMPGTVMFVYFGSLAGTLSDASAAGPDSKTQIVIGVVSGVLLVAVAVVGTVYAKRAINQALAAEEQQQQDGADAEPLAAAATSDSPDKS